MDRRHRRAVRRAIERLDQLIEDRARDTTVDTGGEFGDGRKSRGLRHFDSRLSVSLCESRRFLIDNFSFHLILQPMDGHVASNAPNRPGS